MSQDKSPAAETKRACVYSDFQKARRRLLQALHVGPLYALVTGPSGSGKTSLLRETAGALDRYRFQTHYLAQSGASSSGVGLWLTDALRLSARRTHAETIRAMTRALRELPFRVVLFVDEANLLATDALQELRLLAEAELDCPPLLTVVLAGLPELRTKLQAPALLPLRRRLSLQLELRGLKEHEVAPFLTERLGQAQVSRIPKDALPQIFEHAHGIPGTVESLARQCLESAQGETLDMDTVLEVLQSWDMA